MDSQGESSGNRVLTARHIADKTFPEMNESVNSLNTTVLCHSLPVNPDFLTYYSALQPYTWALWSSGLVVFILVCVLFVLTLRNARAHWRECGSSLTIVLGVYPLVSAAGLVVLLVPRARLLAEAAAQQTVMLGLYHLFSLLIQEAGGEDKLISKAGGTHLETRVLPCCCWPCCFIPRPVLDKRVLTWLRCLVLQLPVVQGLIYTIMLVLWAEDMELYARSFIFFQPFVVASILTGVWGIIMCVRLVEAAGLACKPRFLALQLAMLVVKLQCGAAKLLPEVMTLGCALTINPTVMVHMIQYSIMMVEMLLLSLWAWRLYRSPPPQDKVQHVVVAVLEDGQSKSGDWTQRGAYM